MAESVAAILGFGVRNEWTPRQRKIIADAIRGGRRMFRDTFDNSDSPFWNKMDTSVEWILKELK